MEEQNIEILCRKKEQELLDKYFGKDADADNNRKAAQSIGVYTKELPYKIESEYKKYLDELWQDYSDKTFVLEEQKLRLQMTETDRERIEDAYKKAKRVTLREKITKSNHNDVTFYKGLLYQYTKDLLMIMRIDFLEEITGKHINCKAYED